MKFHIGKAQIAWLLLIVTSVAVGAETSVASKQAEIRKATQTTLEKFYKARPNLKDTVSKAPGYAVFTSYGISFIVGGAGGTGLAHNRSTKKDTYMNMAQASVGLQISAAQDETLIIFKSPAALAKFVDKGWEFSGGASAGAAAGDKGGSTGAGENVIADASYYRLTKNGVEVGGAVAGTKFWKDKDLN